MIDNKRKILYYFMGGGIDGGSDYSLFYHLVNLDKSKFEPLVLYRKKKYLVLKLEEQKIFARKNRLLLLRNKFKNYKNSYIYKLIDIFPVSKTLIDSVLSFFEVIFIVQIILQKKVDILHTNHGINFDRSAIIAGILTRRKIFAHYRGLSKLGKLDVKLTRFVEKIICISNFTKQEYINCGVASHKCVTIYNGVDLNKFIRTDFKQTGLINIGSIGRLEVWKGHHILLRAIPIIIETIKNIKFLIVVRSNQDNYLIKLAHELRIEKYIIFFEAIENVEEIFSKFDIFVHTSIEPEPFGRVIIEAMAMGLPVISTNIGGPKEIIKDGYDGYLLPPDDSKILAEKIIYLIDNPEIRYQIGRNALMTAKNRFDIAKTTKNIEDLYSSVILKQ